MKTITQIASEIGVSRQAVHKKIKQEPLSTSLQQFTSTNGNAVFIDIDGINLIKSAFEKEYISTVDVNRTSTLSTKYIESLHNQINLLTEQNRDLREQLKKENEHKDKLADLAAQLAELTRNNQVLLGAEQSRTNPALLVGGDGEEQRLKKRLFQKIFKRS